MAILNFEKYKNKIKEKFEKEPEVVRKTYEEIQIDTNKMLDEYKKEHEMALKEKHEKSNKLYKAQQKDIIWDTLARFSPAFSFISGCLAAYAKQWSYVDKVIIPEGAEYLKEYADQELIQKIMDLTNQSTHEGLSQLFVASNDQIISQLADKIGFSSVDTHIPLSATAPSFALGALSVAAAILTPYVISKINCKIKEKEMEQAIIKAENAYKAKYKKECFDAKEKRTSQNEQSIELQV